MGTAEFYLYRTSGWLDGLLAAISEEAERLAIGDPQGFASRVAYLVPAPQNNKRPDDEETDQG